MIEHRYIVYRQEKLEPNPIVLITAKTTDAIKTDEELLKAFREGCTAWAKTDAGKDTYGFAGDDMNIGDVADSIDEILPFCPEIKEMSVEGLEVANNWVYDSRVCDDNG